jgi:hypothetical protein
MTISNPVNDTQRGFNELCARGGGQRGGPARTRVQELLADSGRALTAIGHREIIEHLDHYADRSPWHVCFAVGLCWDGSLAWIWNLPALRLGSLRTGMIAISD